MNQQLMNQLWQQRHGTPPWVDLPKPTDPIATLIVSMGRPNCGWFRRMLFEHKALGRIESYAESTGWLWRSFSLVGRKSALEAIYAHLRKIMPEEPNE